VACGRLPQGNSAPGFNQIFHLTCGKVHMRRNLSRRCGVIEQLDRGSKLMKRARQKLLSRVIVSHEAVMTLPC
jgi:hypothetical protein